MLEALLQRDRVILVAGLVAVLAMAWGWLLTGAGMETSAVDMTAMAGMDGWLMRPAVWTPAYAVLIFAMWWVMMISMMLPGAAPMLLLFARVNRKDKATGAHVGLFYGDYFARKGKRSGAWTAGYRRHESFTGKVETPITSNNNNFVKGAPGESVQVPITLKSGRAPVMPSSSLSLLSRPTHE